MICGCGFPNGKYGFEAAVKKFKLMFPNNHTIITVIESRIFNASEAWNGKKNGKRHIANGQASDELLFRINLHVIDEAEYARIINSGIKNQKIHVK